MTRLSDTQCVVLSAAARDENGRVRLPEKLRGGAADAVLKKLKALGLRKRGVAIERRRAADGHSIYVLGA